MLGLLDILVWVEERENNVIIFKRYEVKLWMNIKWEIILLFWKVICWFVVNDFFELSLFIFNFDFNSDYLFFI